MAKFTKADLVKMRDNAVFAKNALTTMREAARDRCEGDVLSRVVAEYDRQITALDDDLELVERILSTVYGEADHPVAAIDLTEKDIQRLYAMLHPYMES